MVSLVYRSLLVFLPLFLASLPAACSGSGLDDSLPVAGPDVCRGDLLGEDSGDNLMDMAGGRGETAVGSPVPCDDFGWEFHPGGEVRVACENHGRVTVAWRDSAGGIDLECWYQCEAELCKESPDSGPYATLEAVMQAWCYETKYSYDPEHPDPCPEVLDALQQYGEFSGITDLTCRGEILVGQVWGDCGCYSWNEHWSGSYKAPCEQPCPGLCGESGAGLSRVDESTDLYAACAKAR